jgi:hypothetical protein
MPPKNVAISVIIKVMAQLYQGRAEINTALVRACPAAYLRYFFFGRSFIDEVRTSWIAHDPELLQVLENIHTLNDRFGIKSSSTHLH